DSVPEMATEDELRALFSRFGTVVRVFLGRDRETAAVKGYAFISFAEQADAERARERLHGYGYHHLILNVEFAARKTV
ncbi:translation initiation factor eIF3 subunit g, partial [Ascosphaera acerosa]